MIRPTPTLAALLALGIAAALGSGAAIAAPDTVLEVQHRSSSLGADGIRRSTEFTERVVRQGDTVWIERVLPQGAHQAAEHQRASAGAAKDHKHADLSAATRWIQQQADGKVRLRLVAAHDEVVVDIAPTEYNTVGFDGSWLAAYHLMNPSVLKKLTPGARSGTSQWYESPANQGGNQIRVLWDSRLELPVEVQTRSANGTSTRTTTARVKPALAAAPWLATARYAVRDYSDFLD